MTESAIREQFLRAHADRTNLLTILLQLTENMDPDSGGETHINGHAVRYVRDMAAQGWYGQYSESLVSNPYSKADRIEHAHCNRSVGSHARRV